jgi:hypothetical protein
LNSTFDGVRAKRLAPKHRALRALFLKSGNVCAFPGCESLMTNANGDFIGQVCHIEAAEAGGPRFNPNKTDEERRSVENLILLCYRHHVETSDVDSYPVDRLLKMKTSHEARFTRINRKRRRSIQDHTQKNKLTESKSAARLNRVLGWNLTQEKLSAFHREVMALGERLERVPRDARNLLAIIANRACHASKEQYGFGVDAAELGSVTRLSIHHLRSLLRLLLRDDLVDIDCEFVDPCLGDSYTHIGLKMSRRLWQGLCDFCDVSQTPLEHLLVDLRFDCLD